MITLPINKPNHHPWEVRFRSDHESVRMRRFLIEPIAAGLLEAGGVLQETRRGKFVTWDGLYGVTVDGRLWRFRFRPYGSLKWVWRLNIRDKEWFNERKFTFLDSEVTNELGRSLAAMFRSLERGEKPVWPMFDHWETFPQYAWSAPCKERYTDWEQWSQQRREAAKKNGLAWNHEA
jgi:hypothetical protein|uniref:hypothetical protein n=1 Tax=Prosthecobacter sp. TaxID=1965333 RepID=UPI0037843141